MAKWLCESESESRRLRNTALRHRSFSRCSWRLSRCAVVARNGAPTSAHSFDSASTLRELCQCSSCMILSDSTPWCACLMAAPCARDPSRFVTPSLCYWQSWALGDDMRRAVEALHQLGEIQALTLQGAGSVFCAGGNPYKHRASNPYGPSGPTSLAASSRHLLESVQVCFLRKKHSTSVPCHCSPSAGRVLFRALSMCVLCVCPSCVLCMAPWLAAPLQSSCRPTFVLQRGRPRFSTAIFREVFAQSQGIRTRCKPPLAQRTLTCFTLLTRN